MLYIYDLNLSTLKLIISLVKEHRIKLGKNSTLGAVDFEWLIFGTAFRLPVAVDFTSCYLKQGELYDHGINRCRAIQNYDKFYVRSKIEYGGIVIYVKTTVSASYRNILTYSHMTCESLYVKINTK